MVASLLFHAKGTKRFRVRAEECFKDCSSALGMQDELTEVPVNGGGLESHWERTLFSTDVNGEESIKFN